MLAALLLSACGPTVAVGGLAPTAPKPTEMPKPTVAPKPVDFKPVLDKYIGALPDGFGGNTRERIII